MRVVVRRGRCCGALLRGERPWLALGVSRDARVTMQWDGEETAWTEDLWVFLSDNAEDEEVQQRVKALAVGEQWVFGGGAQAVCTVKRVS